MSNGYGLGNHITTNSLTIYMKSICVFCGSSEGNDPQIITKAEELGKTLASENITLIYGGAKRGVMGKLANAALAQKGNVIGINPGFLKTKEVVHLGLPELITVENMHERKLKMQQMSDGFITLPGGFGTMEELFEIITWGQLGLHSKPIGLLNINGFYDPLITLLEQMVKRGFLSMENYKMLLVDDDVNRLLEKMRNFKPLPAPKWLKPEKT